MLTISPNYLDQTSSEHFPDQWWLELAATIHSVLTRTMASEGEIELFFVSDTEMMRLNTLHRSISKTTDVLSFPSPAVGVGAHLGDVFVSINQAKAQAESIPAGFEKEILDLVTHGILHIFGFDHEDPKDAKIMFPQQDEITTLIYEKI
ncbi:MAG: rRNA maturation RNase YbeY [Patescibacteria group bacterium]